MSFSAKKIEKSYIHVSYSNRWLCNFIVNCKYILTGIQINIFKSHPKQTQLRATPLAFSLILYIKLWLFPHKEFSLQCWVAPCGGDVLWELGTFSSVFFPREHLSPYWFSFHFSREQVCPGYPHPHPHSPPTHQFRSYLKLKIRKGKKNDKVNSGTRGKVHFFGMFWLQNKFLMRQKDTVVSSGSANGHHGGKAQ